MQRKSPSPKHRFAYLRVLIFVLAVILSSAQATDADLTDQEMVIGNTFTATTLDFSPRHSANRQHISSFFNTTGFLPNGFDIRGLRLQNDGRSGFDYHLSFAKTIGDDILCSAFNLEISSGRETVYHGSLSDLNLNSHLDSDSRQDLIFYLSLSSADKSLANLTCDFNLIFTTPEGRGLSDQELLTNHLSSGVW